ncbi:MAG TPA: hypothetical protein VN154_00955, partial [Rhizomicrobium sp.]|nr:hypothetical protein [Rhizomicrobium sp.]
GAPSDVLQPPIPPPAAPPAPAGESAVERALEAAETAARATARRYAPEVLGIAERAAPPVAFVSTLLDSTSAEGDEIKGDVVGRPDLYWSRRQDETDVRIVRRSDNQVVALLHLGAEDSLVDNSDRVVGRSRKDKVIVDATVLPTSGPSSITRSDEPDLCPKPTDDRDGRVGPVGEKDKDYEDHVKEIVNPGNPTDRGMGYKFPNPKRPRYPVIYDDCRHRTGDLIEAKGTGYVAMLEKPGGLMKEILNFKWKRQATNQIDASQGRELEWYFAEKGAADDARELFDDKPELERIHVIYEYWRPGMR